MIDLGTIEQVDLREVWPHEAANFTPWLADNLDGLGEALGLELELRSAEAAVGAFSLDILARDLGSGRPVIIENQLEATNHDHLGKLLTYAAGYDAYAAVWLVRDFRDEHRQALDWLNQRTGEDTAFFGVVVEAIRIDDSRPALQFRVVAMPNDWRKRTAGTAGIAGPGNHSDRSERYRAFFQRFAETLRERGQHWGDRNIRPQNHQNFSSGFSGIWYAVAFVPDGKAKVEISIERGDATGNKRIFDRLQERQETIQADIAEPLEWYHSDEVKACRIRVMRDGDIYDAPERLAEVQRWMAERLPQFRDIFTPHLQELVE